jgi:two-component system response regulator GlrR
MSTMETRRAHIVVVDDDEELCELLCLRLTHHGFRVSAERTCRGAIEVLEREVVDAILLDLQLDGESGLDLLADVQARAADLPVIVLTAHGSIEAAVESIKCGAYGFLTKPFDDHELVQKLMHAVERSQLTREVAGLRRLIGQPSGSERLIGTSASIAAIRNLIARIAPTDATALILGESGTGKEVSARSMHALSPRAGAAFVAVNCGALPAELLESELFGYKRGAFTGAMRDKEGLFAAADGGTLFLDEIGDAPPSVQVKLLRVLQERCYLPVGSTESRTTDARVIAATNRDLQAEVRAGRFREDLFYRLHVVPIRMPALRERLEDVPLLAELFLTRAAAQHRLSSPHLSSEALHLLMQHDWPGNVRELANVVEGAALLSTDGIIHPRQIAFVLAPRLAESAQSTSPQAAPCPPRPGAPDLSPMFDAQGALPSMRVAREAFDRIYLAEVLRRVGGNVSAAAKLAGRNRTDLHDLLRRYDLSASTFRD